MFLRRQYDSSIYALSYFLQTLTLDLHSIQSLPARCFITLCPFGSIQHELFSKKCTWENMTALHIMVPNIHVLVTSLIQQNLIKLTTERRAPGGWRRGRR